MNDAHERMPQRTPDQIRRLLAETTAAGGTTAPEGGHLSHEEFVNYTLAALPDAERGRVQAHADRCAACGEEVRFLAAALAEWRGPAGRRRLAAMRERILHPAPVEAPVPTETEMAPARAISFRGRLRAAFAGPVSLPVTFGYLRAAAATSTLPWEGTIADLLRVRVDADTGGNLICTVVSTEQVPEEEQDEVEADAVVFTVGSWSTTLPLRVRRGFVDCGTVISVGERRAIAGDMAAAVSLRPAGR